MNLARLTDRTIADRASLLWMDRLPKNNTGGSFRERVARMPPPSPEEQALHEEWRRRWTPSPEAIEHAAVSCGGFPARKAWALGVDREVWRTEIAQALQRLAPGLVRICNDSNGRGVITLPDGTEYSTVLPGCYCGDGRRILTEKLGEARWKWTQGDYCGAWYVDAPTLAELPSLLEGLPLVASKAA